MTASNAVTWTDAVQAIASGFTAIGVLAGAGWAIYKFRGTRALRPRCTITLDCSVVKVAEKQVLRLAAVTKNCGDCLLKFEPTDRARVGVSILTKDELASVKAGESIPWPPSEWPFVKDLLAVEGARRRAVEIEPGQDVHRSVAFALPAEWAVAFVTAEFGQGSGEGSRSWRSTSVVSRDDQLVKSQVAGVFDHGGEQTPEHYVRAPSTDAQPDRSSAGGTAAPDRNEEVQQ